MPTRDPPPDATPPGNRDDAAGDASVEAALLLAAPGRDEPLRDELRRAMPGCGIDAPAPGVLRVAGAGVSTGCSLAFATQVLPDARPVTATSVARWAERCAALVADALGTHAGPWRLHVLVAPVPGSRLGAGRAQLVREQLLARLKERRRVLHRALVADDERSPASPHEAHVQLLLTDLEQGWFSVTLPAARHAWRHVLSRFPGGAVDVPVDRGPPSRAYRKLLEAELHLGQRIEAGQRVLDLGASPGGWSAVALARGASVLAVDRAPLREDLMAHPLLTFVQGDAFKHAPDPAAAVDWLLCDVIAFPERTLELLARWLPARACRRFVVTLKFRGTEDYARLEQCKALLAAHGGDFLLRQLGANGNEVTACGV